MMQISSKMVLSIITKLLLLAVIAKTLALGLIYFLPSDGVEMQEKKRYAPEYQRVDFRVMLQSVQKGKTPIKTQESRSISITNMILKGFYGNSQKGFAIVSLKSSPKKTSIVSVGEVFNGYRLKAIYATKVVFEKDDKEYMLELEKIKSQKSFINKVRAKTDTTDPGEPRGVSREDIASYAKNPKQIWKDISIIPQKKHNKITGFKVTKIKKGSKMAELGLQRGDIIIKANNIRLKSYKDALDLYNKIDTIDTMQIVVLRDNEEVELVYEIN